MPFKNKKDKQIHNLYQNMITRCERVYKNDGNSAYKRRLIGIDESMRTFNGFKEVIKGIGKRPSKSHTLDRIDNNKGYMPGNLRWSTRKQQANNRSKRNGSNTANDSINNNRSNSK